MKNLKEHGLTESELKKKDMLDEEEIKDHSIIQINNNDEKKLNSTIKKRSN